MKSYSLYELNEFIRRIIALNLSEPLWLRAEFAQVKAARGHYFLDLIEKDENSEEIIAQASAVLWATHYRRLRRQRGKDLDPLLRDGIEVLIKVKADFHERYGLKLVIEDIDPGYTLGKLEMRRREIIESLRREKLLERNGTHPLPLVLQRVAVLSSETAAGYQDFLQQLQHNPYGYAFFHRLFPSAMQGQNVEQEMLDQLEVIARHRSDFDAVVIIRGGGARLDLMAFDHYNLAKAIARFPLPVLTGIGHETDETVVDLVAHTALKTPTAVAEFFISHQMNFESRLLDLGQSIRSLTLENLQAQHFVLQDVQQRLAFQSRQRIGEAERMLDYIRQEVPRYARFVVRTAGERLHFLSQMSRLLSPEATLKRGYSLTLKDGRLLRDAALAKKGATIETRLAKGQLKSTIIEIEPDEEKG